MDQELIEKLIKQDPKAQHSLYSKYSKVMFLIILRYINNDEEAKSITNQAFFKIFKHSKQFKTGGATEFLAWMKRIVINEALMYIRKRKKLVFIEHDNELDNVSDIKTDSNLMVEDYYNMIRKLPDGYRLVFSLYAIEGYSHKEIANKLRIKESTSRSQLMHAREFLKKLILEKL